MSKADETPLVSIILPNWNGRDFTLRCLESIAGVDYPLHRIEVIVADNASTDGSPEAILACMDALRPRGFARLHLVQVACNAGAAGAYNRCLECVAPKAEYVLRIDNDTLLEPDCVRAFLRAFAAHEGVGVVGAQMVAYRDPTTPVHGPGYMSKHLLFISQGDPKRTAFCQWLNGAGMMFRASLFRDQRLRFVEEYFLLFEDSDMCFQVARAGYKVLYWSEAKVRHNVSASYGAVRFKPKAYYYATRGRLLFCRRFGTRVGFLGVMLYELLLRWPVISLKALRAGCWRGMLVSPVALWDGLLSKFERKYESHFS